uniref:Uncharacterized protein n=1 Tax=Anguilla anguilla TaxID=7936 RepID=A0A0E9VSU7_ANGAN
MLSLNAGVIGSSFLTCALLMLRDRYSALPPEATRAFPPIPEGRAVEEGLGGAAQRRRRSLRQVLRG